MLPGNTSHRKIAFVQEEEMDKKQFNLLFKYKKPVIIK